MLDKLISQIKSSLPGGKKKSEEDENEDSLEPREEGEEEEETDASDSSSDDDEDDDGDVDKKLEASLEAKKKKTMIIRVVIGLGIGAYLAMPYIFPEKTEEVLPQVEVKKKNRKKPVEATPTQDPAQNTTQSTDLNQANPPASNPTVENTQVTPPPVEDVNITPKDNPAKAGVGLGESTQKENEISKTIDQMIAPTDPISDAPKEEKPVDLKDKIVEEDPYVEPPNYELKGRGLVYNCTDKYWACVEKEAYQKCNKNLKYNKKHSKAIECAIVNVYGSAEDCVLVQKYNISSNAATDFCNGSN